MTLLVQAPDNSQTQYALPPIVHSATGQYYYDLSTTQSGTWFYRWTGAGALQVVVEGSLQVAVTELVPQVSPPGATAFTYNFATEPDISSVRLLCSDTTAPGIFQDAEVSAALYLGILTGIVRFRTGISDRECQSESGDPADLLLSEIGRFAARFHRGAVGPARRR